MGITCTCTCMHEAYTPYPVHCTYSTHSIPAQFLFQPVSLTVSLSSYNPPNTSLYHNLYRGCTPISCPPHHFSLFSGIACSRRGLGDVSILLSYDRLQKLSSTHFKVANAIFARVSDLLFHQGRHFVTHWARAVENLPPNVQPAGDGGVRVSNFVQSDHAIWQI